MRATRRRGEDGLVHETDAYMSYVMTDKVATRVVRCHPVAEFDVENHDGWMDEAPTCLRCVVAKVR